MNMKCIRYSSGKRLFISLLSAAVSLTFPKLALSAGETTKLAANLPVPLEFIVVFDGAVDIRNAGKENSVVAHLKDDLQLNGKVVAPKDSVVKGHAELVGKDGNAVGPEALRDKRNAKFVSFKVVFDEIVPPSKRVLQLHAMPSRQCRTLNTGEEIRSIEVGAGGVIKLAENIEVPGPPQLVAGDELVVRINQDRSVRKTQVEPVAGAPKVNDNPAAIKNKQELASANNSEDSAWLSKPTATKAELAAADLSKVEPASSANSANADEAKTDETKADLAMAVDSKSNAGQSDLCKDKNKPVALAPVLEPERKVRVPEGPVSKQVRIVLRTPIYTKSTRIGDQIVASLVEDLRVADKLVAKKGSTLFGQVESVRRSCRWGSAITSKEARFQRSATVKISFYGLVTPDEREIAIDGLVPPQETVFNNAGAIKRVTVAADGELVKDEPIDSVKNPVMQDAMLTIMGTAQMGTMAIVAMPLMAAGVLVSTQPAMVKGIQKKFVAKGDELYLAPGDELMVQARVCRLETAQAAVSGKVVEEGGKKQLAGKPGNSKQLQ